MIEPLSITPGGVVRSLKIVNAKTLFPEPLSPTKPYASPLSMYNSSMSSIRFNPS